MATKLFYLNDVSNPWKKLILGVPQGSVLGPLFFNIFINDFFLNIEETDICNYADDTTLFVCDDNMHDAIVKSNKWFSENYMKFNEEKCHLMTLGDKTDEPTSIRIVNTTIKSSSEEKLLVVLIDDRLTFEQHISKLCQKVSNKIYALSRVRNFMDQHKLRLLRDQSLLMLGRGPEEIYIFSKKICIPTLLFN